MSIITRGLGGWNVIVGGYAEPVTIVEHGYVCYSSAPVTTGTWSVGYDYATPMYVGDAPAHLDGVLIPFDRLPPASTVNSVPSSQLVADFSRSTPAYAAATPGSSSTAPPLDPKDC